MEPFGLFQFLQNLLTPPNVSSENPPPAQAEPSLPQEQVFTPKNEEVFMQNAAVRFLENHERKAGRRK